MAQSRAEWMAPEMGDLSLVQERLGAMGVDRAPHLHRTVTEAGALQETAFFRDREAFDNLRDVLLPQLIAANAAHRRLRVWCAAVSTGQEAYSVAMLLREHFAELAEWDVQIVATDLSGQAVEYAQRGRYRRAEMNRGLPARMLVKYFVRDGEEWEVSPRLRALCEFRDGDVCVPMVHERPFDLVLMRNVMLFLPAQNRSAALASVHRQIAPEGVLLLGHAEQAEDSSSLFQAEYVRGCCFYRPVAKG